MKYLIILFASFALIACTYQKPNKSKEVVMVDGDPSYTIMKNIDDTNRNIDNITSSIPSPPVRL